ncbi:peptidase M14 [Flavobacterium rhamnosiphilum]|uniref:Peptidase M14 n=1 Tax=Flavobacterium rhamnosiphilum TaxID=2541724 RepID=A0A4R5FB31_9FLAO|nr:M14 family metallopeptidase [Flavobacterium rhamnosiphilum]TDE45960.1 peptidase M14 [Flavobacterium rhamnosiphilum]
MRKKILFLFVLCFGITHAQNDYLNYQNLTKNLKELDVKSKYCTVKSIGKSSGGKEIWLLTISESTTPKPALLITAGLDGKYRAGTQITLKMIENLLNSDKLSKILEEKTIYFVPSVNPDAIDAAFATIKMEKSGNDTKTDDDRDGKIGEDPFEDLNKDGLITQLRIEDITGSFIESPEDSRVLIKADPMKNQVGKYVLISEGIDNDKDGMFNEDFSEGVNIDKNFTFDYPVFEKGAGVYVASEPETRALLDFLYLNQNIYGVLTFGMHNNLSETPKYDSKLASSRIIKGWLEKDIKAVERVSKLYTQKAAIKDGPKMPMTKGNFAQTAYFHAGRFSFSTPGWWVPKVEAKKDSLDSKLEKPKDKDKEAVNSEVSFLKWADSQNIKSAFINWSVIKHPDFPNQKVEVGGFAPYTLNNPPVNFLEETATKHVLFVEELLAAMPKIETNVPEVEKVRENLYRITIKVANKGLLPTYTEIGDKIRFVSKMKTEIVLQKNQSMVSGRKYFIRNSMQADESEEYSWLISGTGKVTITTGCATAGFKEVIVDLK